MMQIIRKLQDKFNEAEEVKGKLAALYENYMTAFNVPRYRYQSYDPIDSTGITANVSRLINSLRNLNKL